MDNSDSHSLEATPKNTALTVSPNSEPASLQPFGEGTDSTDHTGMEGINALNAQNQLAESLMEEASLSMRNGRFLDAEAGYQKARAIKQEISNVYWAVLEELKKNPSIGADFIDTIMHLCRQAQLLADIAHAMALFATGQHERFSRNPGVACRYFRNACTLFETIHNEEPLFIYLFLSHYSAIMEKISQGTESMTLGDNSSAKILFQRAEIHLTQLSADLDQSDEQNTVLEAFKKALPTDIGVCDYLFSIAEAKDQFTSGNFRAASESFAKVATRSREIINKGDMVFSEPIKLHHQGELYYFLGFGLLAEGEHLREQHKWDEALGKYYQIANAWKRGAAAYMESGLPDGMAMQVYLLNQAADLPGAYIRRCKDDQKLISKIKELEDQFHSMIDSARTIGLTVNNNQEMISVMEQNAEIVQKLEINIRQNIENILSEMEKLSLHDEKSEAIANQAKTLLAEKNDPTFLSKVRQFAHDLGEFVEDVGKIAAPLLPFVKALSLMH